jgi:hypothetical protein
VVFLSPSRQIPGQGSPCTYLVVLTAPLTAPEATEHNGHVFLPVDCTQTRKSEAVMLCRPVRPRRQAWSQTKDSKIRMQMEDAASRTLPVSQWPCLSSGPPSVDGRLLPNRFHFISHANCDTAQVRLNSRPFASFGRVLCRMLETGQRFDKRCSTHLQG